MEEKRTSNFELLRIILILFIITLHYLNSEMGGILGNTTSQELNYYIAHLLESICIYAVNCFIIITGYHMIKKDNIKLNKIINLLLIVLSYNIIIYIIMLVAGEITLGFDSIKQFLKNILSGSTWFVIIYSILYLIIPYINKLIENISKSQYKTLIFIFLIAFSIWPTFLTDVTVKDNGYGILNFITLYLIGGFLQKYDINLRIKKFVGVGLLASIFCTFTVSLFNTDRAFAYNSIFNIISAICVFLLFDKINIKSKIINKIAKYTFGIYIIHTNIFLRDFIWKSIARCDLFYHSNFFILHIIITVIAIYLICLIIEIIRNKLFMIIKNMIEKRKKLNNFEFKI